MTSFVLFVAITSGSKAISLRSGVGITRVSVIAECGGVDGVEKPGSSCTLLEGMSERRCACSASEMVFGERERSGTCSHSGARVCEGVVGGQGTEDKIGSVGLMSAVGSILLSKKYVE